MSEQSAAFSGIFNFTAPVILAHPNLHVPKKFKRNGKEQGEPKYSASFVIDPAHADWKALKGIAAAVAKAKWPNRDLKEIKFPWSNGDKLIERKKKQLADKGKEYNGLADYQAGKVVLKTSSKFPPRLAGFENGKVVDYEDPAAIAASKSKFYFGVEVLAQVNFVAYDGVSENPDGVTAYINLVLTTGKGKRLSGGQSAADAFKGYVGNVSAEDPTDTGTDLDDEIPF